MLFCSRLWITDSNGRSSKACIKCKSAASGLKTIPTACTFSRDGLLVAAACQDGSIQMWDHRKTFINTALHLKDAHQKGTDTSCITFGYDNRHVATRNGGDETLKVNWLGYSGGGGGLKNAVLGRTHKVPIMPQIYCSYGTFEPSKSLSMQQ